MNSKGYLLELIQDLVCQNCIQQKCDPPGHYFSGYISTHAEALRVLCDEGLMDMVNDVRGTRAVTAKLKGDALKSAEQYAARLHGTAT